ncbi:MAG: acetyl-CoA carboxylase carboxyl transferase subunit beta [Rickettsiales bacterium]|jgi:acetyl-CoA carboxylase carboxyl transferase subunit beta|nr:acetyl-CoA carboxylase carboxyl transferase subunit beta [Rickettsiales bacterium]
MSPSKFPLQPDEKHVNLEKGLWVICKKCGEKIFVPTLEKNLNVCPVCDFYYPMKDEARFDMLFDDGNYSKLREPVLKDNPLGFVDTKTYDERLKTYRETTGHNDGASAAIGNINKVKTVIWNLNFEFMGGSMGRAVGESFLRATETAVKNNAAFIAVTASGGARMQEGILSLMQMARTTIGVKRLKDAKLPYIVLMTNPTMAGVAASFAMLGDIHIAEKGSEIGFAGRRVIENTIKDKLPEDFQSAEYVKDHGMVDIVIKRENEKELIGKILSGLMIKKV